MGFVARSVARIPTGNYTWYVMLLEDDWKDSISEEVKNNLDTLVNKVGPDTLVIRGLNPEPFSYAVLRAYGLDCEPQMPALVISDTTPKDAEHRRAEGTDITTIVVPLRIRGGTDGSVRKVLSGVAAAGGRDNFVVPVAKRQEVQDNVPA